MLAQFDLRRAHERARELRAEAHRERLARGPRLAAPRSVRRRVARALLAVGSLLVSVGRKVDAAGEVAL
jgi:hypothetical protein